MGTHQHSTDPLSLAQEQLMGSLMGKLNYSAGNPILWSVNSVDTTIGFYSDRVKVYLRAKPITLGSIPP
ncbi:MAG: hypothetical protein EZS28_036377 [Streblomastix strix]|uniref:Uncharacterized protein n=1 Tax=Streblomastix strix TaxID=222440 RepID=A0A5J4UC55_9EUKA|nr:MAG: hypothetical protein EZS28_036377 [Streblomastix strix]